MEKEFYVYILASQTNGTLYIGMTSDLPGRIYDHKMGLTPGFTKKYGVKRLVYFEYCEGAHQAIDREKFLKKQKRAYKIRLIERDNPRWHDLYKTLNMFA